MWLAFPWHWSVVQETAFPEIQCVMIADPCLLAPYFDNPFTVPGTVLHLLWVVSAGPAGPGQGLQSAHITHNNNTKQLSKARIREECQKEKTNADDLLYGNSQTVW